MWRNIRIVFLKELIDTIRDRRTIISMIIVPIIVFPLIIIGFSGFTVMVMKKSAAERQVVAFVGKDDAPTLYRLVAASDKVELVEVDSVTAAIREKKISAAVVVPPGFESSLERGDTLKVRILYDAAESKSEFAKGKLKDIVTEYQQQLLSERLVRRGIDKRWLEPLAIAEENVAPKEKMGAFVLAMILPYMIVVLSMVGAMYTAIDLTAGEKERGTLETILVSPIPRWQLATGKFLTILVTSLVSATIAMISMTITFAYGLMTLGPSPTQMSLRLNFTSVLVIVLLMIPTACLFAATLMTVSIFAKSYKEAQSYVSPLMTVVILPAMLSLIPGVELDMKIALVPLVNVCLSMKQALVGEVNWLYVAVIFLSTAIYAAFAIFITHRMFEKESVLFRT